MLYHESSDEMFISNKKIIRTNDCHTIMEIKALISSTLLFLMILIFGCNKPYVKLTDENAYYGDLDDNLKIETSNATYYFRKSGGGFSGVIDLEGNDWIGHSKAPKSSGMWRGLPNTNIPGWRPEETGTVTKIVSEAYDRLTISCEKNDYECTWTFFPDHATMTVINADSNYYFSYEGAPNGQFDTTTNYFFRPDLRVKHFLGKPSEETDIINQGSESWEWCYFGDTKTNRALFFIHHEDDLLTDYYRPLGEMTVFGFGRSGSANELLEKVPQKFTIGFCRDTAYQFISAEIRNIVEVEGTAYKNNNLVAKIGIW